MTRINVGEQFTTNEGCEVVVVGYENAFKVAIEFDYPVGYRKIVRADHLRLGSIKNLYLPKVYGVGYIGEGNYLAKSKRANTKAYAVWHGMMQRCYDLKMQMKNPSYIGCTVHPDWHNFQNFAEWFYNQEYCDAHYELDKDLLVPNNKIYSPDTCCLIPQELNVLLNKNLAVKGIAPTGVNYQVKSEKFQARISINNERIYLGLFKCPYEAEAVYKKAKQDYVRSKIEEWRGRVDGSVIDALQMRADNLISGLV